MDEITPVNQPEENNTPLLKQVPPAAANQAHVKRTFKRPPLRSNSLSLWFVLPLFFLMGLGTGWLAWGLDKPAEAANTNTQVKVKDDLKRYDVTTDDDPSIGPDDAPITIVEFSDYQCPYCVRWYQEVHTRLMTEYKGKIRFVYRDFPLYSIHPEAQPAAEAANCAGEQNAYWQYHDALFGQKDGLGSSAYLQYASELGLDMEKFKTCVNERRYKNEVDADFKYASNLGVSSTPTFFVNGMAIVGAQPFEVFQQLIDKELAGEIPK